MKSQKINDQIAQLTERLRQEKPELYNMLSENPVTIPNQEHPDLSDEELTNYIATLEALLLNSN